MWARDGSGASVGKEIENIILERVTETGSLGDFPYVAKIKANND